MQQVQKALTQYGLRSGTQQNQEGTEENMVAAPDPQQRDTAAELASIKTLQQNIASDMTGLKTGMDAVQTAVEKLGNRMSEAETRISALEDKDQCTGVTVETATKTIALLQEKVIYLEDAGRP